METVVRLEACPARNGRHSYIVKHWNQEKYSQLQTSWQKKSDMAYPYLHAMETKSHLKYDGYLNVRTGSSPASGTFYNALPANKIQVARRFFLSYYDSVFEGKLLS